MKIHILALGKARGGPEMELARDYIRRTGWEVTLTEMQVKKPLSGEALKAAEAQLLREQIPSGARIIALDERGKDLTSPQFAGSLSRWQDEGIPHLAFLIGGADGLEGTLRQSAHLTLRFGAQTWPHMLVRALLAEQLYRAWSLLQGHPYHRA